MDARIIIILEIIEEQQGSIAFDLSSVSRNMGLSEEYLMKLFQREVGLSLRAYLRSPRMIHAYELIQRGDIPIKQIASACGYQDLSNFYRDFKSSHRMTPRKARLKAMLMLVDKYSPCQQ